MKITLNVPKHFEVKILDVKAGARYWEDSTVNGIEDSEGNLIPCRAGDYWCPQIDIETGKILNWEQGKTADIHYKVCDDGVYTLLSDDGNLIIGDDGKVLFRKDGYVPDMLCPKDSGFGDYIIMDIDENGVIKNWKFDKRFFQN